MSRRLQDGNPAGTSESADRKRVLALTVTAIFLIDAGLGLMAVSDAKAAGKVVAMVVRTLDRGR